MFFLEVQVNINTALGSITLMRSHYIAKLLEKFNMVNAKPASTPTAVGVSLTTDQCPKNEKEQEEMANVPYQTLVGCLLWISNWTRPDIAYATSCISQYLTNPGLAHWSAAKRVLRYLKGTSDLALVYEGHTSDSSSMLSCITDSD